MPIGRAPLRWNQGVPLLGTKDGINRVFTTPGPFRQDDYASIRVYHNGRRLDESPDTNPLNGEYVVSESVPGAGYDTVTIFSFSPVATSDLLADYVPST